MFGMLAGFGARQDIGNKKKLPGDALRFPFGATRDRVSRWQPGGHLGSSHAFLWTDQILDLRIAVVIGCAGLPGSQKSLDFF